MALQPGSPAIDAGAVNPNLPTDQRGYPRPAGTAPDIGAFEVQAGSGAGDPVFHGFRAQRFSFTGRAHRVYHLLSDGSLAVNALFAPANAWAFEASDEKLRQDNNALGTVMAAVAVLTRRHTVEVRAHELAQRPPLLRVDGAELPLLQRHRRYRLNATSSDEEDECLTVKWRAARHVVVSTAQHEIDVWWHRSQTPHINGTYVNVDVKLHLADALTAKGLGGLIGCTTSASVTAESFKPERHPEVYACSHLFASDAPSSQYSAAPLPACSSPHTPHAKRKARMLSASAHDA